MNVHHISLKNTKMLTTDTFYWPKENNVILSFLKGLIYFFNILENLFYFRKSFILKGLGASFKLRWEMRASGNLSFHSLFFVSFLTLKVEHNSVLYDFAKNTCLGRI